MKTYKLNNIPYSHMLRETDQGVKRVCAMRETGVPDELPVDQFSGKKFFRNASGWPMNDIMAYEEAQNDSIARAIVNRIQVLDNVRGDNCETLEERFNTVVPSNWSSPAEYVSLNKKVAKIQYEKTAAKVKAAQAAAAQKAAKAKAAKPDKNITVEPE